MPHETPILGYARAGSAIDEIPGAKRIELTRPSAWPKIVFNALALPILILAVVILLMFGRAVVWNARSFFDGANGVFILFIAWLPAAVAHQLIRELRSLQRAGRRPITLVINDQGVLIDDAAQRADGYIQLNRADITWVDAFPQASGLARRQNWTLRITCPQTEFELRFVEQDPSRVAATLELLKLRKNPSGDASPH